MKKYLSIALSIICGGLLIVSCEKEPEAIPVTGITLDSTSVTLTEGETARLTATVSPSNADNQAIIWSSSNASVASVSNGTVTAVAAGSATITAKSDDGGKTATCNVVVNSKVISVTGVSLDKTSLELTEGDEYTLVASVQPANANNQNVSWSSSDDTIVSVSNGKITALKPGNASISVKTDDGGKTASCSVKVNEKIYPVETISLDKTSLELTEGDEADLTATILPTNATNKNIIWSSSNESVAAVMNGKVTAVTAGTAEIQAKTEDGGKTATCNVTVNAKYYPVESVNLSKTSQTMLPGQSITLDAYVLPDNATDKTIIWTTSNEKVAEVVDGKVTAKAKGETTITAECGGIKGTCKITVINEKELNLADNVTIKLTGTGIIISGNIYYSRTYTITNKSIVDIELVSIATSNSLELSGTVKSGESVSQTLYLSYNIYPVVTLTFKYNGKEYKVNTESTSSTSKSSAAKADSQMNHQCSIEYIK
ncbi:MAG: Ig-like domain-containing protein [Bacteroidia bacterium]|nr:Ig-like domain-containing protein [Bacteroidia bacterium]